MNNTLYYLLKHFISTLDPGYALDPETCELYFYMTKSTSQM